MLNTIETVLSFAALFAIIAFFWYLVRWIFTKTDKKKVFKKRFWLSVLSFVVVSTAIGTLNGHLSKQEAERLGFDTISAYQDAKREGITDPVSWSRILEQRALSKAKVQAEQEAAMLLEKRQAEIEEEAAKAKIEAEAASFLAEQKAKEEAAKAAARVKEKACRQDLQCWGEKAFTVATFKCTDFVERFAKHDYEWTDGMLEPKFSHYRWRNREEGIVTVIGDKIKMQNAFGAWTHMTYECDVEPTSQVISDVRVSAGRL